MMEKIIFDILEIAVIVIASLIGRYVIPYFKNKVDMQKVQQIVEWAKRFVIMAENVIKGQGKGVDKRELVAKLIAEKANELGLNLSEQEIRTLIEDAWTEMIKLKETK
jgi:LL-H family phage holin